MRHIVPIYGSIGAQKAALWVQAMTLPTPKYPRDTSPAGFCVEPPCEHCGMRTGGNWRFHNRDCPYLLEMCEQYPGIAEFVSGNLPQWEGRKGPRKNAKH